MIFSTDKLPIARVFDRVETFGDMVYGDYISAEEHLIPKAKEALLEQVIDTIRELAKKDEFWIVKPKDEPGDFTVAWKIHIPQMDTKLDYKQRMLYEYRQLKDRYNKLHDMCVKYEAGTLDFTPNCSLELLTKQKAAMGHYLHCLEVRAQIEGVAL